MATFKQISQQVTKNNIEHTLNPCMLKIRNSV